MAKVPKELRQVTKRLDRTRFDLVRRTKHWAIVRKTDGQVLMTLASDTGGRTARNQLAQMKREGWLV